jgi:hypothetical protein
MRYISPQCKRKQSFTRYIDIYVSECGCWLVGRNDRVFDQPTKTNKQYFIDTLGSEIGWTFGHLDIFIGKVSRCPVSTLHAPTEILI